MKHPAVLRPGVQDGLDRLFDLILVGIAWIVSWTRFLRALDDLQRKITQDALTATLGVGWVVGFAYVVAAAAGLVADDLNPALFPVLLAVVYLIAFVVGQFRYR